MLFNLELAFGGVRGGLSLINRVLRSKAGRFLSMDFRKLKFFPFRLMRFPKSLGLWRRLSLNRWLVS